MSATRGKAPTVSRRPSERGSSASGGGQSARSEQRAGEILNSATQAFLELGYANCTVDDVVTRAGASKATVYKHFRNKEELFAAVIDSVVVRRSQDELDPLAEDAEQALKAFARRRFEVVTSPQHIGLMRLVIAEGLRLPKVARTYYEHGPGHSHDMLLAFIKAQVRRKRLRCRHPEEAAYHFTGLLMHRWYLWCLNGVRGRPKRAEVTAAVDSAVSAFMTLYGP